MTAIRRFVGTSSADLNPGGNVAMRDVTVSARMESPAKKKSAKKNDDKKTSRKVAKKKY